MTKLTHLLIFKPVLHLTAFLCFILFALSSFAETGHINQAAPDFKAVDTQGNIHQLSDYKGKIIVLEWSNPYCPYVKKHYRHNNMPEVQHKALENKNLIWLTVLSSAKKSSGYVSPKKAEKLFFKKYNGHANAILMDKDGVMGKAYGAKTTPHMYIINEKGVLVYAGAIDDKPSAKASSLKGAKNYVLAALSELEKGQPISTPQTKAYGCSVKY